MSRITVTATAPGCFAVQIEDGDVSTSHRVRVPDTLLADLGLPDADPARIVHESIGFLLEREPSTSILREFTLDDIARYFPVYHDELKARLRA